MPRWFPGSRALWPVALAALAALGGASCSKKSTVVPADGLEGAASPSQLIVWSTRPNLVGTYEDIGVENGRRGPSIDPVSGQPEDIFVGTREEYSIAPGTIQGMIFDFTRAETFEIYRRDGGRLQPLKDYQLTPATRYLPGQVDLFAFTDAHPVPGPAQDYVARGVVEGSTTSLSPKTNTGRVALSFVPGEVTYTGPVETDSLISMSWDPYPGASGYWVHIYRFTDQGTAERILSGIPAPLYLAVTGDYFLGYFPGNVTSYRLGDPLPAGAHIATQQILISGPPEYWLRVSAVGQNGELLAINWATGDYAFQPFEAEGKNYFDLWPMGASVQNVISVDTPTPSGYRTLPSGRSLIGRSPARDHPRAGRRPPGVMVAN